MKNWLGRIPRTIWDWLTLAGAAALVVMLVFRLPDLARGAGTLAGVLTPFAWGLALAYVLDIPARMFTRRLFGGRRAPSIFLSYVCLFGAAAVLIALVVPQLVGSIASFADKVPLYQSNLQTALDWVQAQFGTDVSTLEDLVADSGETIVELVKNVVSNAGHIANAAAGVADMALSGFVALAASIYLLAGKEAMLHGARLALRAALPPQTANGLFAVCTMANKTFSGYIGGQLLDALLVGCETFAAMSICRLDYAPLLAVIVAVTNIIPVLGPFIGAAPGIVILLLESPLQALIFGILILVIQQVDGNFIAPKILGGATGLPGLGVLLAIIVGGDLFGIPGMVAGVPTLAVLVTLGKQAVGAALDARGIREDEVE